MKDIIRVLSMFIFITTATVLSGCFRQKEGIVAYDVTEKGDTWVENVTVHEHRDPKGHVVLEKQSVFQEVKCVGPNNKKIKVKTDAECIKAGGKVVDSTIIKESVKSK